MKKPRAMLIDLDDTIIDDGSGVEPCWRMVCGEAAKRVSGLDSHALFQEIMATRAWYWSGPERHRIGRADLRRVSIGIVRRSLRRLGFDLPGLADDLGEMYRKRRSQTTELIPGAVEALCRFRGYGIDLALITNGTSEGQRKKIEHFDLAKYFDHVLVEGEIGFGKLDPQIYLMAMSALGTEPSETWCIGDNLEWEVRAPQMLGIFCVWIDAKGNGLPAESEICPQLTLHSIAELRF